MMGKNEESAERSMPLGDRCVLDDSLQSVDPRRAHVRRLGRVRERLRRLVIS